MPVLLINCISLCRTLWKPRSRKHLYSKESIENNRKIIIYDKVIKKCFNPVQNHYFYPKRIQLSCIQVNIPVVSYVTSYVTRHSQGGQFSHLIAVTLSCVKSQPFLASSKRTHGQRKETYIKKETTILCPSYTLRFSLILRERENERERKKKTERERECKVTISGQLSFLYNWEFWAFVHHNFEIKYAWTCEVCF